jgi:hypothetical protein
LSDHVRQFQPPLGEEIDGTFNLNHIQRNVALKEEAILGMVKSE